MQQSWTVATPDFLLDIPGKLTFRLWQQAPAQVSASLTPRQAWLFAESVRRMILTSYLLRGTWSVYSHGYVLHTAFVEALPFDIRTSLWDTLSDPEQGPTAAKFGTKWTAIAGTLTCGIAARYMGRLFLGRCCWLLVWIAREFR